MENRNELLKSTNANFGWSLKPITVLMTFFGQEMTIHRNQSNGKLRSFIIMIIGLTILLINIVINTLSLEKVIFVWKCRDIPIYLSYVVGQLFHDLMVVGIPLPFTIIRIFTRGWKYLLFSLETIQSEMILSNEFHRKIRNCVSFSILIFLLVSITIEGKL